jgi:hypothetical protein
VTAKIVKEDGTQVDYGRLGNQKMGVVKITDPNGYSVTIIGQDAMNDEFIKQLAEGIAKGLIAGFKGGI